MIHANSSNNMKMIAVLLALLLVTGALLINVPAQASTDPEGGDDSNSGESNEGDSTDEGGGDEGSDEQGDTEPEPSEPAPTEPTEPIVEPIVPEPLAEPEPTIECPEGYILNDVDECILDPEAAETEAAFTLPPECEDMTPLECLGEKVGAPPPECDNISPLECLDLVIREPPTPVEPEPEPEPIDPCLLDPGHESCPLPDPITGECPEGYNMNEDGQCYPEHPNGCPEGYHSHEDDESGRCIPDSTPCDDGYIMNPTFPSCERKEIVCEEHSTIEACRDDNGDDDDDDDIDIRIKTVIKNIDIHKTIDNSKDFPDIDIIGLSMKDSGESMICAMNINNDWVQCQEFDVSNDRINENIWRVIEVDTDKDFDNANTGSEDVNDAINGIKSQDFSKLDDLSNHEFDIDLAAVAINPMGDGLVCLINDPEGTALCEPFKVASEAVSGQITEIAEIET